MVARIAFDETKLKGVLIYRKPVSVIFSFHLIVYLLDLFNILLDYRWLE